jgi:hypothetical protein
MVLLEQIRHSPKLAQSVDQPFIAEKWRKYSAISAKRRKRLE